MDNMCAKNADDKWTYQHIEAAVAAGLVAEKRVNESCSRVLAQKFAAGLFDDPNAGVVSDNVTLLALLDSPSNRRLALEAAEQGSVLLVNRNATLPLTPQAYDVSKGVALIGEQASCTFDSESRRAGVASPRALKHPDPNLHCKAQLNMLGKTQHHVGDVRVVTVADAIKAAASPLLQPVGTLLGAHIDEATDEADKAAAVALAAESGLALLVLGDSTHSCAECESCKPFQLLPSSFHPPPPSNRLCASNPSATSWHTTCTPRTPLEHCVRLRLRAVSTALVQGGTPAPSRSLVTSPSSFGACLRPAFRLFSSSSTGGPSASKPTQAPTAAGTHRSSTFRTSVRYSQLGVQARRVALPSSICSLER